MWDFGGGPIRVEGEFCVFEEGMGILDFFEECLLRPSGVFSHGISVYFCFSDHSAWNLSVDDFVPNGGFREGDGRVSWCKGIHNCLGRFGDVSIFRVVAESDGEIVFLGPSCQDCLDVVVLGACYIDLVSDNVGGCLDPFPGSISAETEGIDLPVLECRPFGSGIDRSGGFGGLVSGLVVGQNVWVVRGE